MSEGVSQLLILFSGSNKIGYRYHTMLILTNLFTYFNKGLPYFWVQTSRFLWLTPWWSVTGSRDPVTPEPLPPHTYELCFPSQKIFPYVFIVYFSFTFFFPLKFFLSFTFSFPTRKRNSGRIATDARCPVSTFCRGGPPTACGPARAVLATWPVRPARRRINRRAWKQAQIGEGDVAAVR